MTKEPVRKWWILIAMTSCISVIFLDQTILPVCLPTIQKDLGMSTVGLQWLVNAYLLALTTFLIGGGRIGDIFGHRKLFCIGLILFAVASAFCGLSFSGWWFIASRALQGLGGALLMPATSAIILTSFPHHERGRALGLYSSIGSIFLVFGPTIGGFFTQYLSWRYSFWVNLPITGIGLFLTLLFVPPSAKKKDEVFDVLGFFTLGAGVVCLVLALMQGKVWGWTSPGIIGLFITGIGLIAYFFSAEKYQRHPLIEFALFRNHKYVSGMLCIFCAQFLVMNTVFWAIYFQDIIHFSAMKAGLTALISNAPAFIAAPLAGFLVDKVGPRVPVVLGFSLVTFSIVWFIFFHASSTYTALLPVLLPFGTGFPLIFTPSFVYMMADVHEHRRAMGSALNNTTRQLAATLGIAVMGSLFFNIQNDEFIRLLSQNPATHEINPALFEGLLDQTPAALKTLSEYPAKTARWITENYIDAYIKAFDGVNIIAASVGIIGLMIAWLTFKKKKVSL